MTPGQGVGDPQKRVAVRRQMHIAKRLWSVEAAEFLVEAYAHAVAQIAELAAKVARVRARGWSGWPSLPLARAAGNEHTMAPIVAATR